jgi:UDP:flavonoid glycosyltransferase YjiC (YdhE family)
MRFAIAFLPGMGHLNSVLPAYEALLSSGHDVVLCGSPEIARQRAFGPFDVVPVGYPRYRRPEVRGPKGSSTVEMTRASCLDMTDFIGDWKPDLVLCDTSEIGAELAARVCVVPYVSVVSCGDAMIPAVRDRRERYLTAAREQLGLPAGDTGVGRERAVVAFGPPGYFGEPADTTEARCFRYRPAFTPWGPRSAGPGTNRPRRAVLAFGTHVPEPEVAFFSAIVQGLSDEGFEEILMSIRSPEIRADLRALYPDVLLTDQTDLLRELARADLFVCHGSATSTLESLYHGTPPLIIPLHGDTYHVAARCAALGIAATLDRNAVSRGAVAESAAQTREGGRLRERIAEFNLANDALPERAALLDLLETAACTA